MFLEASFLKMGKWFCACIKAHIMGLSWPCTERFVILHPKVEQAHPGYRWYRQNNISCCKVLNRNSIIFCSWNQTNTFLIPAFYKSLSIAALSSCWRGYKVALNLPAHILTSPLPIEKRSEAFKGNDGTCKDKTAKLILKWQRKESVPIP